MVKVTNTVENILGAQSWGIVQHVIKWPRVYAVMHRRQSSMNCANSATAHLKGICRQCRISCKDARLQRLS